MEGVLARAVDYGAKQLNRLILAVMPGIFMLEGSPRPRASRRMASSDVRADDAPGMVWSLRRSTRTMRGAGGGERLAQYCRASPTRPSAPRSACGCSWSARPGPVPEWRTVTSGVMMSEAAP
jgi:hypothetical protein